MVVNSPANSTRPLPGHRTTKLDTRKQRLSGHRLLIPLWRTLVEMGCRPLCMKTKLTWCVPPPWQLGFPNLRQAKFVLLGLRMVLHVLRYLVLCRYVMGVPLTFEPKLL